MPDAATHPSAQELSAYGLGKLPEAAAIAVSSHLETCVACREAVENLPPDSFIGRLQAAKPTGSTLLPGAAAGRNGISLSALGRPTSPPPGLPPELANHPKYSIVRELGQGGMGVVYQAVQTMMDRAVAIKVINPSMLDNLEALPRFLSEVKAAAKLDHPNIVRAYDADQVGKLHLLVMELVEGVSLTQLVKSKGPLPIGTACHFVRQVALGLQHAFDQDTVHRDIKPANLMVTPKGQVKILDFGLARMRSERKKGAGLTQMDAFMGSPEYVSPEQATDARSADIRADIYSLGCTFYFLLTGRPPFQADTVVKVLMAQIEKEPQPIRELRMAIPESLSSIVSKMLAKDPLQRYQKPVEVAQALIPIIKSIGKRKSGGGTAPLAPATASPERPTRICADTSRVNGLSKLPRRTTSEAANRAVQESPFAGFHDENNSAPRESAKNQSVATKPLWRRPPVLAGAVISVSLGFLLILWAAGVISIRTEYGTIVLENLPPNANVLVDGNAVTVKSSNGSIFEIRVESGKKHRLQVKKDGFTVFGEEVDVVTDGRESVHVSLAPEPKDISRSGTRKNSPVGEVDEDYEWKGQKRVRRVLTLEIGGGEKIELVRIKGESFELGSADSELNLEGDAKAVDNETPRHKVTLSDFYISKYPVTKGQFTQFVAETGYRTVPELDGAGGWGYDPVTKQFPGTVSNPNSSPHIGEKERTYSWRATGFEYTHDHPVVNVTYSDAQAFCDWATKKTGRRVKLPTEARYEFANRGGTTTRYFTGDDPASLRGYANVRDQANKQLGINWISPVQFEFDDGHAFTSPVGRYKPNPFGLYDMTGNVWSWCSDRYGKYPSETQIDPEGPGPESGSDRVYRGGAWTCGPSGCRTAYRSWNSPSQRDFSLGFRLALDGTQRSPSPSDPKDAFVPLFNGKDLTGWTLRGPKTTNISIDNGSLIAQNDGQPGWVDHLVSDRTDYTDFRLRYEVLFEAAQTPALAMVRVDPSPVVFGGMRGYLIAIRAQKAQADDPPKGFTALRLSSRVRQALELAKYEHDALVTNTWHSVEVTATGSRIQVVLNGRKALDYLDKGQTFLKGAIALYFPPGPSSRYRNIAIHEMQPATTIPIEGDLRNRWVYQSLVGNEFNERWGVIQNSGGKDWIESVTDHPEFARWQFIETNRTPEYVELERADGQGQKLIIRLYNDHGDIGPSLDQLSRWCEGAWKK